MVVMAKRQERELAKLEMFGHIQRINDGYTGQRLLNMELTDIRRGEEEIHG